MKQPEVLIVGTGAMASLFAARLAAADVSVVMLGSWPQGLAALREHGVRLVDEIGERIYPVRVISDSADCVGMSQALVLVKAWQTARAARQLAECLAPDGIALSLQNGLGNKEILTEYLGVERAGTGITTLGATLLNPGQVRAGGEGVISLGNHAGLNSLSDLLVKSGFQVEFVADIDALVWGKLVVNAAINPLTALLRVPNGDLLSRSSAKILLSKVAQEVAAVATASGIELPFDAPVSAAEDVARRTASNYSSMLQDVMRGTPTEIDAICGAVMRVGGKVEVPTPTNEMFYHLVTALNAETR